MDCLTFRHTVLANPNELSSLIARHAEVCQSCARYLRSLVSTDQQVNRLLAVEVPAGFSNRLKSVIKEEPEIAQPPKLKNGTNFSAGSPLANANRRKLGRYAIAASVLAVVTSVGFVQGKAYLNDKVAASFRTAASNYISSQPELLERTILVQDDRVDRLVSAFGGELVGDLDGVVFAEPCLLVPVSAAHLIIGTDDGPVTVMYAPEAQVRNEQYYEMNDYQILHYPASTGSIALFGESKQALEKTRSTLLASINW